MPTFTFDDDPVEFEPGQSVGAALVAAGITTVRRTRRRDRPRGLFCGIGACFDCLVVVNGSANERACLVAAASDMAVRTQVGTGFDERRD